MKKPKIRFKGFTETWEQRKLNDISEVRDGTHNSPKYQNTGHPFVTSKNIKDGFINYDDIQFISDEDFNEINKRSKVDVNDILMGMIGTIGNTALIRTEPDFAIKNVALIKDTKQINYLYLYHFLHSPFIGKQLSSGMDGGTQKFVSLGNVRNLDIVYPSEVEQIKLGEYFDHLDHLITLHQRKCENLKKLKKFMLQKLFPQNGKNVPKVRFLNFTDTWEQRKLNEIADKVSEKNKNNEFSEPFTNSAEQGIISQKDYFDREIVNNENLNGYYIVRNDDFIYNPRISVTAPVGPINRNRLGRNGVMSPLYTVFRTHDIDNLYLEFYFKTTKWHRFMKLNGDSGARFDRFTISSTQFMKMPIPYPTLEEQQKIGEYFESLDTLITLHQSKCDNLKEVKKYMLQNMFI